MTDSELKRVVESALHREVRLRGRDISVAVDDGDVDLEGTVPQLWEKRLAINLVRRLAEVGAVRDKLRLATERALTDAQICQHIMDAVTDDPNLHEQQVAIASQDGVVTLTGWTNSLEEKRLIGLSAWWVPGVADVHNHIEVIPPQPGDEGDLVDIVRLAFEKDVLVDPLQIAVSVRGTTVILDGSVASEETRQAAEHDAYYIWGVDEVVNRLTVDRR